MSDVKSAKPEPDSIVASVVRVALVTEEETAGVEAVVLAVLLEDVAVVPVVSDVVVSVTVLVGVVVAVMEDVDVVACCVSG